MVRTIRRTYIAAFTLMTAMALTLTLPSLASAAPANDNFADAQTISGVSASVEGTTAAATREIGEPDHYTSNPIDADWWLGDHTVWYRWTAPSSGLTSVDTCTANIDSILAVYTGGSLNSLSRVADNNNDFCGGGWGSKVTFEATAGTTYQIAVGDAGGLREDTFTLNLESEYAFSGFFSPVDHPEVATNKAKAGSAIPVKFSLGGDQGLDIFATGTNPTTNETFTYPTSTAMACDSTARLDAIEETVTAGGSSLQYDASLDQYTYVWKTDKAWAGTCRQLIVKLDDGTYHRANFQFVK